VGESAEVLNIKVGATYRNRRVKGLSERMETLLEEYRRRHKPALTQQVLTLPQHPSRNGIKPFTRQLKLTTRSSCSATQGIVVFYETRTYPIAVCGGWLKYFHRSPASRRWRRKGNPVPGGITGPHPVIGGHKSRDMVFHIGGWTQFWRPCPVEKLFLRNSNKWKSAEHWQKLVRKAVA
jgi:hypothetical protein